MKYRNLIIFLSLLFFTGGCATASVKGKKESTLKDLCEKNQIEWQWDSVSQVVTLNYQGLQAKAMVGSNLVIINNEQIFLSVPLKRKRDVVFVPFDFEPRVIERLKGLSYDYGVKKFKLIMIDPGHGGKDPGAIGKSGLQEKEVVLDISQRLKSSLQQKGMEVEMTRTADEFIPLEDRSLIAHKAKADLFVSVHANSSRARNASGLEVYYLRDLTAEVKKDIFKVTKYRDVFSQFSMEKNIPVLNEILFDMMHLYKQAESKRLAEHLTQDTADAIHSKSRGSMAAGFSVLRNTLIPAVLIEVGFLSNKAEESLLATDSYRQKIADGICESILKYANK